MRSRSNYASVPDPWRAIACTDLVLIRADIPEPGRYYHAERAIVVRAGLLIVEERAVLWHELVHAHRRDERCWGPVLNERQERSVQREAAQRALPFAALVDAARWTEDLAEAADLLKTTPGLLDVRLEGLHPAQKHAIRRAVDHEVRWIA